MCRLNDGETTLICRFCDEVSTELINDKNSILLPKENDFYHSIPIYDNTEIFIASMALTSYKYVVLPLGLNIYGKIDVLSLLLQTDINVCFFLIISSF